MNSFWDVGEYSNAIFYQPTGTIEFTVINIQNQYRNI